MNKKYESHIIAAVGTIVLLCFIFLFLYWMVIDAPKQKEEEYYEIILGDATEQGGESQSGASSEELVTKTKLTPPPPETMKTTPSDVKTQEHEESLETPPQSEEEKIDDYQDPQENENHQEETETQDVPEPDEEKRWQEEQTTNMINNHVQNTFTLSEESDSAKTDSTDFSDLEDVEDSCEGIIPDVPGRKHIDPIPPLKTTIKFPEGTIVVMVKVNEEGEVTDAWTTDGTDISNNATLQLVLEHAKNIKFTKGDDRQIGKITYKLTVQ